LEAEDAMSRPTQILIIFAALILMDPVALNAQVNSQNRSTVNVQNRSADNPGPTVYGGYQIGVGDVLDIHVNDEDDISGRYQVDQSGKVKVPLLSAAIPAAGSTTFELARLMSDELKKEEILRDPSVTVLILREVTQNVSILGAVMRPGVYPIEKPSTLVDVISQAGGLAPNAGNTLTLSHRADSGSSSTINANATSNSVSGSASVNLTALLSAKDPSANLAVRAGDVISVGTAPVVFVVGSVGRPGAFAVQDRSSQMTVLQAIAMAEGPTPTASLGKTIIIRQSSSSSERQEIPIDLKKVMRGKDKDQVLEANDILFVPQSGLKASTRRLGDIGAQAAVSMASYAIIF
jgi:polysaccharide export outer membrane protein